MALTVHHSNFSANAASLGAPAGAPLAVTRLRLTDFRNYDALELAAEGASVVLTGPNGAGKTNLLEAVSFLSPGRGLRRAQLAQATRRGADGGWAVNAALATAEGPVGVGTGLMPGADGGDRRVVKIDGKPESGPAALGNYVRIVWLTPQMDRLFADGPSVRRQFLDRLTLGLDAEHGRVANRDDRAMRQRTRLLIEGPQDAAWLGALEEEMAAAGTAMAAARVDMTGRLAAALSAGIGPFPTAQVALDGTLENALAKLPAVEVESRFRAELKSRRAADAAAGRATDGPHLSDLAVRHQDKDADADQCSTGEQKALLVAMILANARLQAAQWGASPLVLLDEVVAHLDDAHRGALIQELKFLNAQAWITGTDPGLFDPLRDVARFFTVTDGRLLAA